MRSLTPGGYFSDESAARLVTAIDVSNYTGSLLRETLLRWQEAGIGLVIVQAVDPLSSRYPPTVTRQQLEACEAVGIPTDAYLYLWHGALGIVERNVRLLDGYNTRRLWLDCEDSEGAGFYTNNIADVSLGLRILDDYAPDQLSGVYTAGWYWRTYVRNTDAFSDRPLWGAQYDGVPDLTEFSLFGGWSELAIKQYAGTSVFEGQGGVDLNVALV